MKKIYLFVVFTFIFLLISPAQEAALVKNTSLKDRQQEIEYQESDLGIQMSELNDVGGGYSEYFYYGDPSGMFLNNEWEDGKAVLIDGSLLEGHFRYNLYKQKMQAVVETDTFAFAKPCEVEMRMIGEQKFIYSNYIRIDHEVSNAWFEVLNEGSCDLLLRRYIKYRVDRDGDDDPSNDQLYKVDEYYMRNEDGSVKRIFMTEKSLLEALNKHETEVSRYIKDEKLKFKQEDDLRKLFAYYNSLE